MDDEERTKVAVMANDIQYIKKAVDELKKKLEEDYVQKNEFEPVQKIVYGMTALVLTTVLGAIIVLVVGS